MVATSVVGVKTERRLPRFLFLKCNYFYSMVKKVNHHFFKVWTSDMAYVLGFFCADGSISTGKNGSHYFSIQIKDRDLLEDIKKVLQSEHKITKRIHAQDGSIFYRLQIGSNIIWQDLYDLGIKEQKTKRLNLPKIPDKLFFDFVRGYFDGDGGVWVGKIHNFKSNQMLSMQVYFTSSSCNFLKSLSQSLLGFGIRGSLYYRKNSAYVLRYSAKSSIILYREMYAEGGLYLPRKKEKFEEYINAAVA